MSPLGRLPARPLEDLIEAHVAADEDPSTLALMARLRAGRERGYLTKGEFAAACRWKTPRSAKHVAANSRLRVRKATGGALRAATDRERLEALLELKGVSVPTASAILTLLDPERYGVLDIRVWQLLHRLGEVRGGPSGTGLTVAHCEQFLAVIRSHAGRLGLSARSVELALFQVHRVHQRGNLYG